jgi:hypothetical protein
MVEQLSDGISKLITQTTPPEFRSSVQVRNHSTKSVLSMDVKVDMGARFYSFIATIHTRSRRLTMGAEGEPIFDTWGEFLPKAPQAFRAEFKKRFARALDAFHIHEQLQGETHMEAKRNGKDNTIVLTLSGLTDEKFARILERLRRPTAWEHIQDAEENQ